MIITVDKNMAVIDHTQTEIDFLDKSISERFRKIAECMHNAFGVKSVEVEIYNSQIPKCTEGECKGMPNMSMLPEVDMLQWVLCNPKDRVVEL